MFGSIRDMVMKLTIKKILKLVFLVVLLFLAWKYFLSPRLNTKKRPRPQRPPTEEMNQALPEPELENGNAGLEATKNGFTLNGNPFRIIGGSFHYFRTHPAQWQDRLEKMKAAGLNTVITYIPWNLHEKVHEQRKFNGFWNLLDFIEHVHYMKFYLIIRAGPYICAEWEFGGFPSWLLHDPNMVLRTSKYASYLHHVDNYFNELLPLLAKHTYKRNGPIIAFQIENEFGSLERLDRDYLKHLMDLHVKHGIHELFLTSDGSRYFEYGSYPGVLETVNFNDNVENNLNALKSFQPDKPLMVTEFWPGWFDHWGEKHHGMSLYNFTLKVDAVLSMGASINFYMFVGGTNFGFWNGGNLEKNSFGYSPTITSYDYDALISENGDCHPTKYSALRQLLQKHQLVKNLPPIPPNSRKVAYGSFKLKEFLAMDDFLPLVPEKSVILPDPIFMEFLNINNNGGQGYGWILYRKEITFSGKVLRFVGEMRDGALMYLNGVPISTLYGDKSTHIDWQYELKDVQNDKNVLEMLVENMGRANYLKIDAERRGFQGSIYLDNVKLSDWEHFSLEFCPTFLTKIRKQGEVWESLERRGSNVSYPTIFRVHVSINDDPEDTFLDMRGWTKGLVIVNGFNLGRYWKIGPQRTLFVPKPVLRRGSNEIIVFELETPSDTISFVDTHLLDNPW